MYCPKCGVELSDSTICYNCDLDIKTLEFETENTIDNSMNSRSTIKTEKNSIVLGFPIVAVLSFCIAVVFFWMGYDKINSYNSGELGDAINAYVGGDAYNFIINAQLATGYFTLGLAAVVNGNVSLIIRAIKSRA